MAFSACRATISILSLFLIFIAGAVDTKEYIIIPTPQMKAHEKNTLELYLSLHVGGMDNAYTSIRPGNDIPAYWVASLPASAFAYLKKQPFVDIVPNGVDDGEPAGFENQRVNHTSKGISNGLGSGTPVRIHTSLEELRFLSQPPTIPDLVYVSDYVYSKGLRETFIYLADTGVNTNYQDFHRRAVEWVYTGLTIMRHRDKPTDESPDGHGTCVASKAVGNFFGAAKEATLVVVKMPDYSIAATIGSMETMLDHIAARGREEASIVLIPWNSRLDETHGLLQNPAIQILRERFKEMWMKGIRIVCAAGNHASLGRRTFSDTAPAIFSRSFPVFVVSSCNSDGRASPSSQMASLGQELYAPGSGIQCAGPHRPLEYHEASGTSFSAALVAGVLANLLASEQLPKGMSRHQEIQFVLNKFS
ncbi:hypothetical protein ACLMJK_003704 [Lecanora helva]